MDTEARDKWNNLGKGASSSGTRGPSSGVTLNSSATGGKASSLGWLWIEKKGEMKSKIAYYFFFFFAVEKMRFTNDVVFRTLVGFPGMEGYERRQWCDLLALFLPTGSPRLCEDKVLGGPQDEHITCACLLNTFASPCWQAKDIVTGFSSEIRK